MAIGWSEPKFAQQTRFFPLSLQRAEVTPLWPQKPFSHTDLTRLVRDLIDSVQA
jgi:hypothetical protein